MEKCKNLKLLSLEPSTKVFSLAVSEGEKVIASRNLKCDKGLSSSIIGGIRDILKKARILMDDLDGFAIGLGPGSFTSLRVGLSTVKAFCFVTNKPVVGISSLDILANTLKDQEVVDICTLSDAKRKLVYACSYVKKNSEIKRTTDYLLIPIEEVLETIKKDTVFIGDGIGLYKEQILKSAAKSKWNPIFVDEKLWSPKAKELAALARKRFQLKRIDDVNTLVPLYLYPQDCQVRR